MSASKRATPRVRLVGECGFFNLRVLVGLFMVLASVFIALGSAGLFLGSSPAQAQSRPAAAAPTANSPNGPDAVSLVGPVRLDQDLRTLPYVPPKREVEERVLTRYPHGAGQTGAPAEYGISGLAHVQALLKNPWPTAAEMPLPLLTFDGQTANSECFRECSLPRLGALFRLGSANKTWADGALIASLGKFHEILGYS